jgi:hypothetical protein
MKTFMENVDTKTQKELLLQPWNYSGII